MLADDNLGISWDDAASAISGGAFVFIVIGGIALIIILAAIKKVRCSVCGLPIMRVYYLWTFGNTKERLCPGCNSRMKKPGE